MDGTRTMSRQGLYIYLRAVGGSLMFFVGFVLWLLAVSLGWEWRAVFFELAMLGGILMQLSMVGVLCRLAAKHLQGSKKSPQGTQNENAVT